VDRFNNKRVFAKVVESGSFAGVAARGYGRFDSVSGGGAAPRSRDHQICAAADQ
jgi:hypothetical protein